MIRGDLKVANLLPGKTWKRTKGETIIEKVTTMKFTGKLKDETIEVDTVITLKFDTLHSDHLRDTLQLFSDEPVIEIIVRPSKQQTLDGDYGLDYPAVTRRLAKGQHRLSEEKES